MTTSAENSAARVEPFIESGEAFRRLGGLESPAARERFDVVVIGGGQAGLSVGLPPAQARPALRDPGRGPNAIGDTWRKRWDSLRLFTPAKFDGLVGMKFPAPAELLPDEGRDGRLPGGVRGEVRAARPQRHARRAGCSSATARSWSRRATARSRPNQVVVAMANYQSHRVPAFARELRPDIVQMHSCDYRNPAQLRDGGVLIVGAGNSGAEIAKELAGRHEIWMSRARRGEVPFDVDSLAGRAFLVRLLLRVVFHRVLTVKTPIGRKARPKRPAPRDAAHPREGQGPGGARGQTRRARHRRPRRPAACSRTGRWSTSPTSSGAPAFIPGFSWIDLARLQ